LLSLLNLTFMHILYLSKCTDKDYGIQWKSKATMPNKRTAPKLYPVPCKKCALHFRISFILKSLYPQKKLHSVLNYHKRMFVFSNVFFLNFQYTCRYIDRDALDIGPAALSDIFFNIRYRYPTEYRIWVAGYPTTTRY
jgi:hypothetical protein